MADNKKRFRIEFTVEVNGESNKSIEDMALQELTCMSPYPEDITFSEVGSNWHTGTPTEEGWYLLHYPKSKEQPYELARYDGEDFIAVKPFHAIIVRIEASSVPYWQKIEED